MISRKKAAAVVLFAAFTVGSATTSFAGDPKGKCNSGNGNGSETVPESDCDPGNSGGHNNGGD